MADTLLNSALSGVAEALEPLSRIDSAAKATEFFGELGYGLPGGQTFNALPAGLIAKVIAVAEGIANLATAEDDDARLRAVLDLALAVKDVAEQISQLHGALGGGLPGNFLTASHIDQLPRRLLDYLISKYIEGQAPGAYNFLLLFGIADEIVLTADPGTFQAACTLRKIWWERLPRYFTEPRSLAEEVYHWESDFDSDLFLQRLERVLRGFLLPGGIYTQNPALRSAFGNSDPQTKEIRIPLFDAGDSPELYVQFGLLISSNAAGGKPKGLALIPYFMGSSDLAFSLSETLELKLETSVSIDDGVGLILRPPLALEVLDKLFTAPLDAGTMRTKLSLSQRSDRQQELILFGSAGGSRFSIKGLHAAVFASKEGATADYGFEAGLAEGRVVISTANADGFLATMLSGIETDVRFSLTVGFSSRRGVYFEGSGSLEVQIPLHLALGPILIEGLLLSLRPSAGQFPLTAGTNIRFELGPLQAVAENLGLRFTLSFPDGGGNLGPANFDLGFKPPTGVGLSVNAGVVVGGGYLYFDFEREEYAGALELTFSGYLSLKAIGLVTTRMPDGSKGFSLLIIITVEFGAGIQLGFGFTLIGVGGLLGLNRAANGDALLLGVRNGGANNIMFPRDVLANAPRIISDLRAFFPPENQKFLIGPMAKLGWGTPPLVTVSLGIIVELSTRGGFSVTTLTILGVLRVVLPDASAAVLVLQVTFLGRIEFDRSRAYFFASLFESRVLFMTIEGEMGMLIEWGANPNFVLSVGGFHPRFNPPPTPFPTPHRIAVELSNSSVYRVRIEGYFAVTSNTVQFGARAELKFDLDVIAIVGQITFDALFQFSPFYFIIDISASVSLKVFGTGIFSIRLNFSLAGPTPWRARGTGHLEFLFWEISADFDVTWGEVQDTSLPPITVFPIVRGELDKVENWKAELPSGQNPLVTLRRLESAADTLVLHPMGVLRITQRAVPLELTLDKVGSQKPDDFRKFALAETSGTFTAHGVDESFAVAQFQTMSDAEKLSRPAFQPLRGGLELSGAVDGGFGSGKAAKRRVRYETIIIDTKLKRKENRLRAWIDVLFAHFFSGNAVAKAAISDRQRLLRDPFKDKVEVPGDRYTVAFTRDNAPLAPEAASFASEALAKEYLDRTLAGDPSLTGKAHVIPSYEAAA
jgi:hypothetical protein